MVSLVRDSDHFGTIIRPVRLNEWPNPQPSEDEVAQHILAGPVVLDVYGELIQQRSDDLVQRLEAGVLAAGVLLNGWNLEQIRNFKGAVWRSAHRFIVDNIKEVDRGPELDELARALKVDL